MRASQGLCPELLSSMVFIFFIRAWSGFIVGTELLTIRVDSDVKDPSIRHSHKLLL